MKKILISGGDGFIGRNLISELLKKGHYVTNIDNNITSYPQNFNSENYKKISADVSEVDTSIFDDIDIIIHLASIASPLVYKRNPKLVINPNVFGSQKLIELAERVGAKYFFSSTSEVYGHFSEDMIKNEGIKEIDDAYISLLTKRSCYSVAKRLGEELALNFYKNGGKGTNFRLFNVYGCDMDLKHIGYGRVIPNFFNKLSNNEKIQIFGDGKQIRSFLWIEDLIEIIIKILEYNGELPTAMNIGNDEPISIIDLSYLISSKLDCKLDIEYLEKDQDDPLWRRPNINLLKSFFDWKPKTSLDSGLSKIAKGYLNE